MYYYDENGRLAWTRDEEKARREHAGRMLAANHYGLAPRTVGRLAEVLGPVTDATPDILRKKVSTALRGLGIDVPFDVALEALPDDWRAAISVGRRGPE